MGFLMQWLVTALAIIIAAFLLPGVTVTLFGALIAALAIGFLNALIKPVLIALTLPVNFITLGLFTFVINALLIMLASAIVPGFKVDNFWWALLFSIILSIVVYVIGGWAL